VVVLGPLPLGQGRGHHGHHLVLLALKVGQEGPLQPIQGVEDRPGGTAAPEVLRGLFDRGHARGEGVVVVVHRVEQRAGKRVVRPDTGPQPSVLALVVLVQERHQPDEMLAESHPLTSGHSSLDSEELARSTKVAPQGAVDDPHDTHVGRRVQCVGHSGLPPDGSGRAWTGRW
jgi:hypothetical protein